MALVRALARRYSDRGEQLEDLVQIGAIGLIKAIDRFVLDDRERKILHLRFFKGLTQSQIAQQVGISQMHVSRLIRRSLEKIRDEIAAEEDDTGRHAASG